VYRHILSLLYDFFGDKAELVLAAGLGLLALAAVLLLMPPWRRTVRAAWDRGGWRGVILGLANGLLQLVVGATIVAGLGGALLVQSGLFNEQHGQITQSNYEAIQTNWGSPHEQRELTVAHYVTEEETFLLFKDGRQVKESELGADGDNAPGESPVKVKREVRKNVPQNSIVRAAVAVDVKLNYRAKGPAYYTCYEDTWDMTYLVKNRSAQATEAEFGFAMPAEHGKYDGLAVTVGGKDWMENLVLKNNVQTWKLPMKPGEEVEVRVRYASRGMEHLRYQPARMAVREQYKVTFRLHPDPERGVRRFVWAEHMGLPIGSMTPTAITDSPADGGPMVLEWDMSSMAASLGMGVVLPGIKQPGYYVARLLHEAPLGMGMLAAALVVTWMLLGRPADLFSLGVLAVAYYLFYTFIAYLSDHSESFTVCFVWAAAATLTLAGLYVWLGWGRNFAANQTMALVAAFTVYYPLAVVMDQYTGLLVQILYWTLATYVALLAVAHAVRARQDAVSLP
jgi:hypothetical protein